MSKLPQLSLTCGIFCWLMTTRIFILKMRRLLSSWSARSLILRGKAAFSEMAKFQNSFLSTTNLPYIENLYEQWLVDRASVPESFGRYFQMLEETQEHGAPYEQATPTHRLMSASEAERETAKQIKMRMMIDAYRNLGHQFADKDPLGLPEINRRRVGRLGEEALHYSKFGFAKEELNESVIVKNVRDDNEGQDNGPYTVTQFEEYLKGIYCDKVGYEYMHLLNKAERDFIKQELEEKIDKLEQHELTKEEQLATLRRIVRDQTFLDFLVSKFPTYKRFTLEGLNAATSSLGELVESGVEAGIESFQFGMAHRGRLNVLHCVFDKPAELIFREFLEKAAEADQGRGHFGDVKYHLGYTNRKTINGKECVLSILPNPSHLEAVDPLVYGSTRAIQEDDNDKKKSLGVVIHGDAALAGQGIVYESLGFQDLVDYSTGGIIHIVLNNQIGFTTTPNQGRSSYYCTEIAKTVDAPVIHVNADEPDILDKCMRIAVAYRQKFQKDIFIDIIGYRRFGHNEQDQPMFTQPIMYNKIKNKAHVCDLYSQKLIRKGVIDADGIQKIKDEYTAQLEADYKKVIEDRQPVHKKDQMSVNKLKPPTLWGKNTGVPRGVLGDLFKKITTWPADFNMHPVIKKIYMERIKNFEGNENLDWATMESLAWASILHEGYGVRVSGQDVERGTFSHRHALISDQQRDVEKFTFLKNVSPNVRITNSHLSEYGVLGFEYGYSITNPNSLVIWEAQFGDFANGAAIMIDNFIASGEVKWGQQSGIVLSLPHGMDGQGPEHSQARIERFLQLSNDRCDEEQNLTYEEQMKIVNMQIIYCSTTSNYFHALRRQIHRDYRKPLIACNSKKLLKFKGANRPISEILEGTEFVPVYPDDTVDPKKVKQVLICNGQVYYDLLARRTELKKDDVAIVRIEQLAPFPHEALKKAIAPYSKDIEYAWVQEQHENYGPWNFVYPRLRLALGKHVTFYGRPASAATAVGAMRIHKEEGETLLTRIFQQ